MAGGPPGAWEPLSGPGVGGDWGEVASFPWVCLEGCLPPREATASSEGDMMGPRPPALGTSCGGAGVAKSSCHGRDLASRRRGPSLHSGLSCTKKERGLWARGQEPECCFWAGPSLRCSDGGGVVLSCSGAASPKPTPPEREEGPLGGHRCSGCLHPTSMPTACLGPKSACCLAYPPSSTPHPFLSTPPSVSKDRAGMTLGRLEVRLRMLDLAWVWSLSLSGQEHRPRLLTWAPPIPPVSPLPGVDTLLQQ